MTSVKEALIHRPKPTLDEAVPPGNGIAALALLEAGHLFADARYLEAADRTIVWARSLMEQYPAGHCTLLSAMETALAEPERVIIRGPAERMAEWSELATTGYRPWRRVYAIAYEGANTLPPYLPKLVSADLRQSTVAYICQGTRCSLPIEDVEAFKAALEVFEAAHAAYYLKSTKVNLQLAEDLLQKRRN